MPEIPKLLAISGSLREGSFCTAILRTAAERFADNANFEIFSLASIPLYNQDLDNGTPPDSVAEWRNSLDNAAGLVIATPEYNYGISGVLKNALDWASRPYGKSKLLGKPVLTLSASPAFTGGVRAQAQLTETLISNAARLLLRPQIAIGLVHEKVKDGRLIDELAIQFIADGLQDLLREIAIASANRA